MSDDRIHVTGDRLPFAMIPRWVLRARITAGAVRLYVVLQDHVHGREGPTSGPITRARLAAECQCSMAQVDRYLIELVKIRAVVKSPTIVAGTGQRGNRYHVHFAQPGDSPGDNRVITSEDPADRVIAGDDTGSSPVRTPKRKESNSISSDYGKEAAPGPSCGEPPADPAAFDASQYTDEARERLRRPRRRPQEANA